jgi:hypothetical protein
MNNKIKSIAGVMVVALIAGSMFAPQVGVTSYQETTQMNSVDSTAARLSTLKQGIVDVRSFLDDPDLPTLHKDISESNVLVGSDTLDNILATAYDDSVMVSIGMDGYNELYFKVMYDSCTCDTLPRIYLYSSETGNTTLTAGNACLFSRTQSFTDSTGVNYWELPQISKGNLGITGAGNYWHNFPASVVIPCRDSYGSKILGSFVIMKIVTTDKSGKLWDFKIHAIRQK